MVIRGYLLILTITFFLTNLVNAQENTVISGADLNNASTQEVKQNTATDTIPVIELTESDLNNILDLRTQFEKQNSTYSAPVTPNENLLRFLKKDEAQLSDEAMYWAHLIHDASTLFDDNMTFRDTIIVSPLFLPLVFKGGLVPDDLTFYNEDSWKPKNLVPQPFAIDTIFKEEERKKKLNMQAYNYIRDNYPNYFRYSENDLPQDKIVIKEIQKVKDEPELLQVENEKNFDDVDAPVKFIPERRYWTSHFESAIQFAQNYISPNWHKGGNSAMNLANREYFIYNYNKDKVLFTNELEIKNTLNTAPNDTLRSYKISDDVFRLHSNFGYRAINKWYYSFDMEFRTQIFSSFIENSDVKQSAFLAPYTVTTSLGMKYDLNKKFKKKNKSLTFNAVIGALSCTFKQTTDGHIDLGRHFKPDEETGELPTKQSQFGSNINATLNFQINKNVNWYSRFYYNTSYSRIEGEFENRISLAISRFFSTTITLNLRYDDGIAKKEDYDHYLQINELLSFGFRYKW